MNDLEKQLKESFGHIHAEPSMKAAAMESIQIERRKRKRSWFSGSIKVAAAAACMLLVFLGGYGTRMFFEPVTVISIDINPSIELGINAFDRVVTQTAYNSGGENLLNSLDLHLQKWEDALNMVVDSAPIQELLHREEALTLTVVGKNEQESISLCSKVEDQVGDGGNIYCVSASSETVAHAHNCGLSYGKYLAYLEALEAGQSLTPEEAQRMTMKQIRELTDGHHGYGHHGSQQEETQPPQEETVATTEATTAPTEETAAPDCGSHGSHKNSKHNKSHHH